jgi:hypothetical protein
MSAYTLSDFNAGVDVRLKQPSTGAPISSDEIDTLIQNVAAQIYSKHKPFKKTCNISADNSYLYLINGTTFPGWIEGFSDILNVEYPADQYQDPADARIPFEEYEIYEKNSLKYLRFLAATPTSGYTIRPTFTIPHTIAATTAATTVYDSDFGALCDLAACICCRSIATKFGFFTDSTIGADAVEYRSKSDVWAARAKNFWDQYMATMFPECSAALAMIEFDTFFSGNGIYSSRLTHTNR